MPQVRTIESKIRKFEGFDVKIMTPDGADVRSDKSLPAHYDEHVNRAADSMTVADWRRIRFSPQFPGYDVEVLQGDGRAAHGRTMLKTLRASYV